MLLAVPLSCLTSYLPLSAVVGWHTTLNVSAEAADLFARDHFELPLSAAGEKCSEKINADKKPGKAEREKTRGSEHCAHHKRKPSTWCMNGLVAAD
jgi:hypothetical protein